MRRLALQAVVHMSARVISALLSFMLFAWVGKVLNPEDAVHAFQFLFIQGFAVAASRACLHISARIDGKARRPLRLRRLHIGFSSQIWLLLPLCTFVFMSVWLNTRDIKISCASLLIFIPACFDSDAVRSVIGLPSYFAIAFSLGSLLSLLSLYFLLPATFDGVISAFFIQWAPVCLLNFLMLIQHRRLLSVTRARTSDLLRILLAASFDGIVLNASFFGVVSIQTEVALSISLVIRIFVAALPLLPLLMHWSNSPDFPRLCSRLGITTSMGFSLALISSGLIFGCGFSGFYHYTNNSKLDILTVIGFVIILVCFSIYFSSARFSVGFMNSTYLFMGVTGSLIVYIILLMYFSPYANVLFLASLQGAIFLFAAYLMSHANRTDSQ